MVGLALALGLMGAGALVKGGTQLGFGISDRSKGNQLEAEAGARPDYEVPDSIDSMISQYQDMANGKMPGYDLEQQGIQGQTARTVGSAAQLADSPVGALGALGAAQDRELGAMQDLNTRAQQYQAQAKMNYANATGQRAQYEDQQWRQNELLPWETDMNRAMQYQTSGAGNIMGAADSFGSSMTQMGSMAGSMAMSNGMMPNYGNTAAYNPSMAQTGGMIQQGSQQGASGFNINNVPYDQIRY